MKKLSVRSRLTAVYAGLFMLTGAGLLVLNFTLLDQYLPRAPSQTAISHAGLSTTQDPGGSVTVVGPGPDSGSAQFFQALQINTTDLRDATLHQLLLQSSLALVVMGVLA